MQRSSTASRSCGAWRKQPSRQERVRSSSSPATRGARSRRRSHGLDITIAFNPAFASGLASSLKAGLSAMPLNAAGALVLLGDMPRIEPELIDALIDAFLKREGALAAAPLLERGRGNPVLLGRGLFEAAMRLDGDEGARRVHQRPQRRRTGRSRRFRRRSGVRHRHPRRSRGRPPVAKRLRRVALRLAGSGATLPRGRPSGRKSKS